MKKPLVLRIDEVAAMFGVCKATIGVWVKGGAFPRPMTFAGLRAKRFWDPQAIDDFFRTLRERQGRNDSSDQKARPRAAPEVPIRNDASDRRENGNAGGPPMPQMREDLRQPLALNKTLPTPGVPE